MGEAPNYSVGVDPLSPYHSSPSHYLPPLPTWRESNEIQGSLEYLSASIHTLIIISGMHAHVLNM